MAIGISPTVDFAFKMMLGSPEHSAVTIHFLNAILHDQPRITQVEILNPFLGKNWEEDKECVLDVLATDEHGRKLNIEMQTSLPLELKQRLAYYASSLYVGQLKEGDKYVELRPAISICVLTQALFSKQPDLHLDFRLRERTGVILTDDLQIHLLQLSKLQVTAENVYHASPLERWAYFMKHAQHLTDTDISRLFPDQEFSEAAGVLQMISRTPDVRVYYNAREKFLRDQDSILRGALKEGIEQGRQEGRILLLQQLLGLTPMTADEFAAGNASQLAELEEQLQRQMQSRSQSH